MSLTTKAIQNLALKQNKARTQGDRLAVIIDLVIDLGWDRDRLSEDGQRTYDELCEVLHLPSCKEDDDDKHLRELQEQGLNGYDKIESEVKNYPFNEGDDYYTLEDGEFILSCWDYVSEDMHDANPNKVYYREPNLESRVQNG